MKRPAYCLIFGLVFTLGASAHSPDSKDASAYVMGAQYPLGGAGGWDYLAVDSTRHHLFLSRGNRVDIMDTSNGKIISTLAGTDGVHGIAIAATLRRGYTSNGKSDSVTEFDLDTLQRVRDIPLSGHDPDAILFDAFSGHVFAINGDSTDASVIDPSLGKEIAKIALPGGPEFGVSDGLGHIYINIEDKAELVEVDSAKMQILQTGH